jgi:N-acetylglutamate synthase-like GNAT family acetyltransferase
MMKLASGAALTTATLPAGRSAAATTHSPIALRRARASDLQSVNNLIAAAIDTWSLADRVKRISLPLYRYHEDDLRDMQLVVAHSSDDEIFGIAALEQAYANDLFDGLQASVLHGIYVAPNLHRNGVGSALLEKIENMASSNHTEVLLVKARPEAISFFSSHGYGRLPTRDRRRDYPYQLYKRLTGFARDRC